MLSLLTASEFGTDKSKEFARSVSYTIVSGSYPHKKEMILIGIKVGVGKELMTDTLPKKPLL